MIVVENLTVNGTNFVRHYSDAGFYIVQNETGIKYSEAVDVEGAPYTYTETEELIEAPEEDAEQV